MSSIDKLKRLTGENVKTKEKRPSQRPEIDELRRRIDAIVTRGQERERVESRRAQNAINDNLKEFVSGEEVENNHGKFFLVTETVHGSSRHGHRNIREAFGFDMTAAAMLANNHLISNLSCGDALFLDTETTGLSGGTGTMAFLIGLGWFKDGHFHMRQILSRDFSEEKAALTYLAEIASQKKFLITFNGKAFDINLLNTRFIMNRLRSELSLMPHLDLLHPSRRILGHRLANSRLVTLEAEVLGVEREGDIPGWEIPQRYFDWLRKRDGRLLTAIIEHNRLDVISMASLTAHLTEILGGAEMVQIVDDTDYMAAARLLLKRREKIAAAKVLTIVSTHEASQSPLIVKKELSLLYKRTGKLEDAVRIWEEILETMPADFFAIVELAKCLEHRLRDIERAKQIVKSALECTTLPGDEAEALSHRLIRLERIKSKNK
jgi:hypothetical protein